MEHDAVLEKLKVDISGNAANKLSDQIRQLILTREIPPKYAFPRENIFCEQLGVGRSTLREAYKALESNGYITRTKRGTFVNDPQTIISAQPFSAHIETSDFMELLEFRAMFEAELSALAAQRATPEHIKNMEYLLEQMQQNKNDLQKLTYYDTQFHMEIANASGNHLLINTMNMAIDSFSKGIYSAFQKDTASNVAQAISYHKSILFAIKQQDSNLAQSSMRSHVQSVRQRLGY